MRALFGTLERVVGRVPGAWRRQGEHTTRLLVSRLPLATLNGVFTERLEPDADEVAEFAGVLAKEDVPWSVQVRGEPAPALEKILRAHGLTQPHALHLMAKELDGPAPVRDGVRVAGARDQQDYADVLTMGFEAPREVMGPFASPALLEAPWATAYLREQDGEPVATSYAVRDGRHVGLFNVATLPRHRRHGHGRAVVEAAMGGGYAEGARWAYLQAADDVSPWYASMGFRTLETWTYFLPG
ncbi:GNAT family N-acetyltransferase [Nonomuraea aridisoli]|uniref:GNAT family N-acetyltransferase n=1 Tax=Nonomuraea aridisoli TaxID=2070368 RepID=A0A2W2EGB0_9ACTN|nr:GNAT family N-acetyltransferase [Nonomuraea aridisoli]